MRCGATAPADAMPACMACPQCPVVHPCSLMSDYEVTLVNDNMQEFYIRFNGPAESASPPPFAAGLPD